MSHHYDDNVLPLVQRRARRPRQYGRLAKVIPLHPHLHDPPSGQAIGAALLAIVTAIVTAGMLLVSLRSGNAAMSHLVPAWPWW
jgi:hypothetical protein